MILYLLNFYLQMSNTIKYYKPEQQATAVKKAHRLFLLFI